MKLVHWINKFCNNKVLIVAFITVACAAMYYNSISSNFSFDDEYITFSLEEVQELGGSFLDVFKVRYNNSDYRPVTILSFYLEQRITDLDIQIAHGVNILIFIFVVVLIYLFVLEFNHKQINVIALVCAIIFLTHPIHSNVVSSLKNRDCLLSCFFGMISLIAYIRLVKTNNWFFFLISLFTLIISVLSKLEGIVFIVIAGVAVIFFSKQKFPLDKKLIVYLFGTIGIFLFAIMIRKYLMNSFAVDKIYVTGMSGSGVDFEENPLVASKGFWTSLLFAAKVSLKYLEFMIKPFGYYFYFGTDLLKVYPTASWNVIIGILFNIGAFCYAVYAIISKKTIGFAIAFYLLAILPFLNIISPIAGIYAVRYAFIASIGYAFFVAILVVNLYGFLSNRQLKVANIIFVASLIIWLIVQVKFTYERNAVWQDKTTLFQNDIPYLTKSFNANYIVGTHHLANFEEDKIRYAELQKAIKYFQRAIDVYDKNSKVYSKLGICMFYKKDYERGETYLLKSLDLSNLNIEAYMYLSDYYLSIDKNNLAIQNLKQILAIESNLELTGTYFKLTNALNQSGRAEEARAMNEKLIQEFPDNYVYYQNIANSYLYLADTVMAVKNFEQAINLGYSDPKLEEEIRTYHNLKSN